MRYILLFILTLTSLMSSAQITIGGDVYGGGKHGAVGTGNTTATGETATTAVTLTNAETSATDVTITTEATVRTVFGGGMNGRCYGQTNVTIEGGIVGDAKWNGTIHGGVFGAGDGAGAYVFGKTNTVTIKGGTVWNNIYGGGNQADLMGSTAVILQDGTLYGSVFGGARMANIFGHSYVNLDGEHVPDGKTLIVPAVYGGNDISGTIATSNNWAWTNPDMPFTPKLAEANLQLIDKSWAAFVRSTYPLTSGHAAVTNNNIFVGTLYGGGNGDYAYTADNKLTLVDEPAVAADAENGVEAKPEKTATFANLTKPELDKTYLNLQGGTFGNVYGGGNNATVTVSTDIMVWNAHFDGAYDNASVMATIPKSRISEMGLLESMFTIDEENATAKALYQINNIFGGNNKADMAIRPNWYLAQGTFNNIYSGGNQGRMTHPEGILISIGSRSVFANNVYGGCRMADVAPLDGGGNAVTSISQQTLSSLHVKYEGTGGQFTGIESKQYTFEPNYATRVYITEGHINNVYGGNDISGTVHLGSNVVIEGAISGNVYGGGNGSYAYTDNAELAKLPEYKDLYYDPSTASSSIEALNAYRPHVENTLLHIFGSEGQQPVIDDANEYAIKATGANEQPVIVTGGIYCGGNSATIDGTGHATFKIGKNAVINAVFLGSNGENMVTDEIFNTYKSKVGDNKYSTIDLTDRATLAKYMEGCAVNIRPTVTYEWKGDEDPHTYIGSLYGGGNVGSVTYDKAVTLDIPAGLKVYDRVVGGCRAADIDARADLHAGYEGGFSVANTGDDASKPKLTINMDAYLEPRELHVTMKDHFLSSAKLDWDKRIYFKAPNADAAHTDTGVTDKFTTLYGANVFGGCYASGHIAGDVTINVTRDLVSPAVFSMVEAEATAGTKVLNGLSKEQEFEKMGNYVFAKTMTIYGGGYGEPTTIRGDVRVNLSQNARVLNVMGGADYGMIGTTKKDGWHAAKTGNTYVTTAQGLKDYSALNDGLPYNCMQIYGGAFFGTIYGHTELRLNSGSYLNAFGGSCDADIADYSSVYLGNSQTVGTGYPYIKGDVFGGNDFGGIIGRDGKTESSALVAGADFGDVLKGYHDFSGDQAGYNGKTIRTTRYLEYNSGRIGLDPQGTNSLYGGSYGSYEYNKWFKKTNPFDNVTSVDYPPENRTDKNPVANEYIPTTGDVFPTNTYVNVRCQSTNKEKDYIARGIFGGGRGIMNILGIVDAHQTYVYLHGANWAQRGANLSYHIYGGGYYSIVENTKVDLESGCAGTVYGGSYGTSAKTLQDNNYNNINYNSTRTEVNLYSGMDNADMEVFGGGGYAGVTDTYVNLYGGKAHNVYGGSYNEGFCHNTHILVPDATNTVTNAASTANVNAIFGGGYGANVALPCDEETTNITFASATAYVKDMIYGGNNAKRAAKTTNITISAPVKTAADGNYVNICGAGNDECTVAGFTNINLNDGARVGNVYGGGRDGKVFGYYKNIEGAETYYGDATQSYVKWFCAFPYQHEGSWEGSSLYYATTPANGTNLFGYYKRLGTVGNYTFEACKSDATANGTDTYYQKYANTNIFMQKGAVATNVYGGGLGSNATVAGSTRTHVHGGTITENYFGGGESGNVLYQNVVEKASNGETLVAYYKQEHENHTITEDQFPASQKGNIYTYACIWGGEVKSAYGGGLDGQVGTNHDDLTGETRIEIGEMDVTADHYAGIPNVRRSVYGGGYRGAVNGTAKIQMLNGYIGYDYEPVAKATGNAAPENFKPHVNIEGDTRELLKESGNIFGGGYGEGATTDHTIVNMYNGTIRNSLYGGGEIASVGVADVETIDMSNRTQIPKITSAGSTEVNLYGGLVRNNVFGGGRGYAIDAYGNTQSGEVGYSDGYTFGKTFVNIYRGTVGTDETLAEGNGNVFGGGNIGYIYGADYSRKNTSGDFAGYYNTTKHSDGYYYNTGDTLMSEDSKVVVTPWARVVTDTALVVNGTTYNKFDYVPHDALDKITDWETAKKSLGDLDKQGVIIRNAVFAGGNVSAGSDKVYANAYTIYGNSTASVVDCLNKDLVTIGADDIGGLYGDGNLTFVDGYRELNITNYGTDYYSLQTELTIEEYQKLNDRERAYFELKYVCTTAYEGHNLKDQITGSEYNALPDNVKTNWTQAGFCTLYAGRMMNTIQRADFCGVFGSRMVLKGAQDRVPSEVDYTKYTINRVGELSLNQMPNSQRDKNGNYFGIYNVVNFLGAITSDVKFTDVRTSTSTTYAGDGSTSYYDWKHTNLTKRSRNNGTSKNKVALASGVWLELVKQIAESSADKDVYNNYTYKKGDKIYGPITGIVELDIINAATGEGGGYVYALNEHGEQSPSGNTHATLTAANNNAISYKQFQYTDMTGDTNMETTGNFINADKRIVDDCYPNNGIWLPGANPTSTAHYWFIRGDYYVYDQFISAYTGAAQSYAESVKVPLTITAEAHGKLRLLNVQDNFNACWTDEQYAALDAKYKLDGDNSVIIINSKSYSQNSPISFWDYSHLTDSERLLFKKGTYVVTTTVGSYQKGQVLTKEQYDAAITEMTGKYLVEYDISEKNHVAGDVLDATQYAELSQSQKNQCKAATECFSETNAVDTDHGFVLTYVWDNPKKWSDYYIAPGSQAPADMVTQDVKKTDEAYNNYMLSPTFKFNATTPEILGQREYIEGALIDKVAYDNQRADVEDYTTAVQATFEAAYAAQAACKVKLGDTDAYYVKGAVISATDYNSLSAEDKAKFGEAYTCTSTQKVSDSKYYVYGDIITEAEYNTVNIAGVDKTAIFSPAYLCTKAGAWGGTLFESGNNYSALKFCDLNSTERANFQYNLDAFDVLKANATGYNLTNMEYYHQSDGYTALPNYADRHTNLYAAATSIDYTATYTGTDALTTTNAVTVGNAQTKTLSKGSTISRADYETKLVNEIANYAQISVYKNENDDKYYDATKQKYYIVKSDFYIGDTRYAAGSLLTSAAYNALQDVNKEKVDEVNATNLRQDFGESESSRTFYYCTNAYTASTGVMDVLSSSSIAADSQVNAGTIISRNDFAKLKNEQQNFVINGAVPTETSTLYVSREPSIDQLSQDKIVTVIYEYSYVEAVEDQQTYETIKERHIINIHVHFESGLPTIGELLTPMAVLPGNAVGLNQPSVSKGAYEILGGGWEIYANPKDAQTHSNGEEYTNNNTKMYWYQNGYEVAYYAKSYLGKTYSNTVPITVANYHRMADIMANGGDSNGDGVADYMYLNEAAKSHTLRDSKVYVKDAAELDNMKAFFDLTKAGDDFTDIHNCNRIDFIADGDINHATTWTPIGDADHCFSGDFHGDGHTISGLDKSLFGNLCGNVYNTGVTGSFTTSGITDAGDGNVHNCWVVTSLPSNQSLGTTKAIHGGTGTVTNSYYYNDYAERTGATKKPLKAFLDGEVAYDLNGYYLGKRHYPGSYPEGYDPYVESRYGNEDFIFADGVIPQTANIRRNVQGEYHAIYPDDYIFFGQNLSYGIVQGGGDYVDQPQAVRRQTSTTDESKNTKLLATDITESNRVYRAPAYYKSKDMKTAYFNQYAAFAGTMTLAADNIYGATSHTDIYRDLTAIDFTGHNDTEKLDYEGLKAYTTDGLTRNLLVYADPTDDATSYGILNTALPEATLTIGDTYKDVAIAADADRVKGHLVDKTNDGTFKATRDHYLYDKEKFNCPISYKFDNDHRMWYQREPDNYVDASKGWEAISLPFTADLVSTQTKGEITHFYKKDSGYNRGYDSGHEYWLREFKGEGTAPATRAANTFYAAFEYPKAAGSTKEDGNTFLWDYYYSHDDNAANNIDKDANQDDYQTYYNSTRAYESYPRYAAAVPYIIGFPGSRYYEFDLSGQFEPENRLNNIGKLDPQTISFVSATGSEIKVSDGELSSVVEASGVDYTFTPNYMDDTIPTGTYVLNAEGSSFDVTTAAQAAVPFRPYFKAVTAPSPAPKRYERIHISGSNLDKGKNEDDLTDGDIRIWSRNRKIYITNGTTEDRTFRIYNPAGATINIITVPAGSQGVTPVNVTGVYLVDTKRLLVR